MGLKGKLSAEIEIKSYPENYFKRLKEELHHLPDAASGVHGVEDIRTPLIGRAD